MTTGPFVTTSARRLHVVGCRRSGTTLLFELLTTCFEHDEHCEHERSIFETPLVAGLSISKKPSDLMHIRGALTGDPELYVVNVMRDPRSVVSSIHPSHPHVYFSSFERWARYERAASELSGHPRYVQVSYENLVRAPLETQTQLQQAFPFLIERHPFTEFARFARTSGPAAVSLLGVRPIDESSRERWREHLPRLAFQVSRYPDLAASLIRHGYETSDSWLDALEGVRPLVQAYGETRRSRLKTLEAKLRYGLKTWRYLHGVRQLQQQLEADRAKVDQAKVDQVKKGRAP